MDLSKTNLLVIIFVAIAVCTISEVVGYENVRHPRDASNVKIAIATTDAKSDSEANHGMAASSSSTKGNAAFIKKHRRSSRDVEAAIAVTDAKSDSKAEHGMAASSSSTKGGALFVSKNHHAGKHRRSARSPDAVKIAVADTNAESDSKAKDGMAASSSSTKGNAAFITKHHGKQRRSARDVEAAIAVTDAKSDSKAEHGMAASSSSTKGGAAFVSKNHHAGKHRRSARSLETVKIAVADTNAESDSKAKDGMASSSSATKGSAAFVSKKHHRRSAQAELKEGIAVANTDGQSDSSAVFPVDEPEKKLHEQPKPSHNGEDIPVPPKEEMKHAQENGNLEKEGEAVKKNTDSFLDMIKKHVVKFAEANVNI